ncbi:hypothetical protein LTS10_000363 [Elasticomyces elasticus]|nr:hypothetical protein LTS10_000363 [Elasticomyces elasticus]
MDSEVGKKCHLLALPPELRNRIYEYAFADEAPLAMDVNEITLYWPSAALPGTCHQLHNETLKMMRAAVMQFTATHICTIELGPFDKSDNYRKLFFKHFTGSAYSSAKIQNIELRIGNGGSQSARTVMSDGPFVKKSPTKTLPAATLEPLTCLRYESLLISATAIMRDLPATTARRWRQHCRDTGILEGQMDYQDPRTWDIKDIVQLMYGHHGRVVKWLH